MWRLIGFDDFELAEILHPTLTVVRQPADEVGRVAAGLLFDRLKRDEFPKEGNRVVLPVELIVQFMRLLRCAVQLSTRVRSPGRRRRLRDAAAAGCSAPVPAADSSGGASRYCTISEMRRFEGSRGLPGRRRRWSA